METKKRDISAKTVKDITDATLKVNNFIIDGFLARTLSDSFLKLVKNDCKILHWRASGVRAPDC